MLNQTSGQAKWIESSTSEIDVDLLFAFFRNWRCSVQCYAVMHMMPSFIMWRYLFDIIYIYRKKLSSQRKRTDSKIPLTSVIQFSRIFRFASSLSFRLNVMLHDFSLKNSRSIQICGINRRSNVWLHWRIYCVTIAEPIEN